MEDLINFLNGFNVQTILSMAVILWYFVREIRNEIRKEIETQVARTDRLYEMFIDLLKQGR